MKKIKSIVNEVIAKKVTKKLIKQQKKEIAAKFEEYILCQMLLTGKTRKELVKEIINEVV